MQSGVSKEVENIYQVSGFKFLTVITGQLVSCWSNIYLLFYKVFIFSMFCSKTSDWEESYLIFSLLKNLSHEVYAGLA